MGRMRWDWSPGGRARVYALTALGTIACISFAFAFDSFSFRTGHWRWGTDPVNDLVIPLIVAPPILLFLLTKLRQLAIAHRELMTVASTDGLTSLLNRRAFTAMVDGYLARVAEAPASPKGALLVVDVDHFKSINDRFGHDRGDQALKLIATTIKDIVRDVDLVGRLGGEEFCVFMPGLDHERTASAAERIRRAVDSTAFVVAEQPHQLSVSIGGATFAERTDFGALYRCADHWLYCAKESGRNRVEIQRYGCAEASGAHAPGPLH